jgi:hypothetical protein
VSAFGAGVPQGQRPKGQDPKAGRKIKPAIGIAAVTLLAAAAFADDLAGRASVIDGDTLEIHGTRIRLWGIDAPESDQLCRSEESERYRCGQKAANDLDAFIDRRPVGCVEVDRDQYGRAPLRSAPSPASTLPIGWCVTAMLSTGPNIQSAIMPPLRTKPSAPIAACGAAVLLSLGAIGLAENPVDLP